jgi:hypothetical protein
MRRRNRGLPREGIEQSAGSSSGRNHGIVRFFSIPNYLQFGLPPTDGAGESSRHLSFPTVDIRRRDESAFQKRVLATL